MLRRIQHSGIFSHARLILLVGCWSVLLLLRGDPLPPFGECTLGMVRAEYTSDDRPILWKNRDVTNINQVVHLGGGNGNYRYVGIGYGNDTDRVYGGVNEHGFAIANSNSYNLGAGNSQGRQDDGTLQTNALKTCASLAEFRSMLDTTNTLYGGRTQPANYFVFDSTGQMSVFETAKSFWYEVPVRAEDRYGVRANYSYRGDQTNVVSYGRFRHNRADRLFSSLLENGRIRFDSLFPVTRDIATDSSSTLNYLPPDGSTIRFTSTICRSSTASAMIIQGGKHTAQGWIPPVAWFLLGKPFSTIAVPVWVNQTHVSTYLTDTESTSSLLCAYAKSRFQEFTTTSQSIESHRLTSMTTSLLETERSIIRCVEPRLNTVLSGDQSAALSDSMAALALATMQPTGLDSNINPVIPISYSVGLPSPNPFNSATTIRYSLVNSTQVNLYVYDCTGREIDHIVVPNAHTGTNSILWRNVRQASGMILFRIAIDNHSEWRKAVIVK